MELKDKQTKTAIYARVSTQEQDSLKQIEICKQYCERNQWEIKFIFNDIISGKTITRPEFDKLLEAMRRYEFNTIVVTKLDRMGRSLKHLLSLFDEFNAKGINFVAVTQNIDTSTSAGKLQMQIMGAFAEFERNLISERTKEGLKGNERVGKRGKDKRPRQKRGGLRKPTIYYEAK